MNTNNNVLITDNTGMLTWQAVTSCAPTCHHFTYSDVVEGVATLTVILGCVVLACRFLQYVYDFINDREVGSRFFPNINSNIGPFEGFGFDVIAILVAVMIGLVCALLWIVAIPLLVIIGLMFFLRYIVRMKKKIDKVTDES